MTELTEILDSIDIEFVLQREGCSYRESYGRSGRQLNIRECPACHHSEWKFYMGADTGLGSCFSGSCPQKMFSKWSFMKHLFGLEGRQLVALLKEVAREQGWRPVIKTSSLGIQDLNDLEVPNSTPAWEMNPVPEYLARRGIFADLAEHFQLRYSEIGKWSYVDPTGRSGSQDYSNRIIIPIFDLDGSLVSFQGRDVTGEAELRYVFPPGFASAGAYLFNGFNVTDKTEGVVITEGVFDCIKTQATIAAFDDLKGLTAISTFGMHMSTGNPSGDDQMGRLRQIKQEHGVKKIIFLWDGERKAAAAAIKASLDLVAVGFTCLIALIPDGKDPGKAYPSEIHDAIKSALPCRNKIDAIKIMKTVNLRYKTA